MISPQRVVVLGATGFVGASVCAALRDRGHEAVPFSAPRIDPSSLAPSDSNSLRSLTEILNDCHAVVNAAGLSESTSIASADLHAANAILPGIIAQICAETNTRFVHVSSAAVQGRRQSLDSSFERSPFSIYSESKARGEIEALRRRNTVVYRPPGVHGVERQVTQKIASLARSRYSSVAGRGDNNTAQALIENVGDAIAYLATCLEMPPCIVHHPSEGQTASSLLEDLGGRAPLHVPRPAARALTSVAFLAGRFIPSISGHARRLEMLWFGQQQADSWLTQVGWRAPIPLDGWQEVGRRLAHDTTRKDSE